jgi:hypothetical protein
MNFRRLSSWLAPAALVLGMAAAALLPTGDAGAANAPPITVPFDHLSTGFELDGVHRDLPCEACHLNAVFKGTPRACGVCHIQGSTFNATPKTTTHIMSTNNCAACHDTTSFRPAVHFDHMETMGSCVTCHNGTIAQGEGPTHPATSTNCAACHTVVSWNPPSTVDHTQIPMAVQGFCIICHNGTNASGKNPGHITTALECGDCHLTTTWLGANFDHTGIVNNCYTCHNGVKAAGKQGTHMPTTNLCENCHTTGIGTKTPNWVPSLFDHTQMTSQNTCLPCHSGTVKLAGGSFVQGQPSNHVPLNSSTADCILCHGNTPAAETWTVLAATIPVLHTGLSVNNCLQCHAGQTFAGVPAPYIPMSISGVSPTKATPLAPPHIPILAGTDCSSCHGAAYQAGGFGPATAMSAAKHAFVSGTCDTCHDTGKAFYVGSGTPLQLRPQDHISSNDPRMATSDCSGCHTTTDWTSNTLPAGHMPNPSSLTCSQCHASAPADYTPATLAANSVLHTGITGNCGLCHGNTVTALTWFNNFTPKDAVLTPAHIPYLAGTDCSSCHSSSTYAVGTFGPMNMTQATHAFVPTSCDTCHEAGLSFTMGTANPALQGRPADHNTGNMAAPNDCSGCHTTANWNSNVLPPGHMPNPANQACATCHIAIGATQASYATLASIAVLHTGITANCGACHGALTPLTWFNNSTPKDAVLTPAHIPYTTGTDCSSCHATNYVTGGFGPTNMTAAKHAFVPGTCDLCHEANLSFYLGASTPALQGRPADHQTSTDARQVSGDCSLCHTTTDWTSNVMPPGHMPNPGNQACSVCHTAIAGTLASYATLTTNLATMHTGITGGCAACHGSPAGQLTFYNNNDNPKAAAGLSPAHIPYSNGVDCSSCHATNYAVGGFGPTMMSAAKHAYVPTTCDTCHEAGLNFYLGASGQTLQGRPQDHINSTTYPQQVTGDCSGCHETTDWIAKVLPAGHMPNPGGQACTVCHTSAPTNYKVFASTAVLHTGISNGCAQCHGGATQLSFYNNDMTVKAAASLSPAHIPAFTGEDCSACHTTNYVTGGFGPMNMTQATHAGVGTTCNPCHEAGLSFYMGAASPALQGRPADHNTGLMVAPNDCNGCHTTANWNSNSLPAGHMPNPASQACATCHTAIGSTTASYATLASIAVLHTGITSNCSQCHGSPTTGQLTFYNNNDNPKAAVLTPAHIPFLTGTDCSSCHSTNYVAGGFGPMNMTQATHTYVPGAGSCVTCHEAGLSFYMGAASPALQGRPADHTASNQVAPNDCANSGCHTTANWNSSTLPAGHMPNPGNQTCATCHTAINGTTASYATLASISVLHTGITNNCSQCHGLTQLTFYNNNDNPKSAALSPSHIAFLSGTDCVSCHKANYVTGGFGPMNMTQATHAYVAGAGSCVTCHEAGLSFYMGAASPALQGRPTDHTAANMAAPNDCANSGCHTTANWNSGTLPAGHMPNPGNQGCSTCHTAIGSTTASYATLAAVPVLHTGITSGCITCHSGPNAAPLTFYNNNDNPKSAAGLTGSPHIPTANTPCEDCHSLTTWSFANTSMTQGEHTSMFAYIGNTCDACHNNTTPALAFYGVTNLQVRPSDHYTGKNAGTSKATNDCSGCHSPKGWDNAQKRTVAATASKSMVSTVVAAPTAKAAGTTAAATAPPGSKTTTPVLPGMARAAAATPGLTHAGVTTNCVSCHNGVLAAGKPAAHIASNNSCENCHTTLAWLPARFDHQGLNASCASCHNGIAAPGKPATHVKTSEDCSSCHGTIAWLPATFSHVGVTAACATCHNGIAATGKQAQHVVTTQDCGTCHNTISWTIPTPAKKQLQPLIPHQRGVSSGSTK